MEGNIEGTMKVTGLQILDHHREMKGLWKLEEEILDCTLWRRCF
jgi:hypothetical protein